MEGHTGRIEGVILSRDEENLFSWSEDKTIRIWGKDGKLLHTIQGHGESVKGVIQTKDEKTLISWSEGGAIRIWNTQGKLVNALNGHTDSVKGVILTKDEKILISSSEDKTIRIWNRDGKLLRTLEDKTINIEKHFDKEILSLDGINQLLNAIGGYTSEGILLTNDEKNIISWVGDENIRIWNIEGELLHTLKGHTRNINGVLLTNDEKTLISWSRDDTIRFWNRQGKLLNTLNRWKITSYTRRTHRFYLWS